MTEVITFEQFVASESRRLWKGDHHKKSVAKAAKFGAFADFSTRHIGDYKPMQIHQFLDYLTDTLKLSDNTANHYAAMIAKVFTHAVEGEIITHAPKFKWKDKADSSRIVYFSRAQTDAAEAFFANHPESWMKQMVIIGWETGMRHGEIVTITPSSIVTDADGCWVELTHTKNGDDRRVPINPRVRQALADLNDHPATYYTESAFYRSWGHMRHHVLNGNKDYVFHCLRHTCATHLAANLKLNSKLIATWLGHRDIKTTHKYIKATGGGLQAAASQFA